MTEAGDPRLVKPAEILARMQGSTSIGKLASKIQRGIEPPGTPDGKFRLGFVVSFDPTTWTVTALIGDQLTQVPNIPVLAGVVPVAECAAYFGQVSGGSTTEYTLLGMLPKGPSSVRIRKTADQNINNSATLINDNDLKFYALAGRTYLFEAFVVAAVNSASTAPLDIKLAWGLPSGATWTGGGPGPDPAITNTGVGSTKWFGLVAATTAATGFGTIPFNAVLIPTLIPFQGSIKMGATSGMCNLMWAQQTAQAATTVVYEGSYLKADMTSEYTL
jgi:hypothetical protein